MAPKDPGDPERRTLSNPNIDIASLIEAAEQISKKGGVRLSVRERLMVALVSAIVGTSGGGAAVTAFFNFVQKPAVIEERLTELEGQLARAEARLLTCEEADKEQDEVISSMSETVEATYVIVDKAHPARRFGIPGDNR